MGRPRQAMCGNGLHSFNDPANYYVVFDKVRGQSRRKCRPCALARKRADNARKARQRAQEPRSLPWFLQLEWTGPHTPKDPWQKLRRRKRFAQNYRVNGHPIAYRVTPQQALCVQGLADGLTIEEIAERGCASPNAVRLALGEVRLKYGVTSNAAAVAQGLKRGAVTADRVTARRLPRRIPYAAVQDMRALVLGERLPHKAHGKRIWRTLDPLMSWTEPHAVSVLWAARLITSRDVPQTRNRYRRRRTGKRSEDTATWKAPNVHT